MNRLLLGIDIGSSSCKACVVEETGAFVASASCESRPISPRPGWLEQDPEQWFQAALACLDTLREGESVDLRRLAAVATTGQMKGITFIGADGRAVRNSILWNDLRSQEEVVELRREYGDLLERLSFNPFNNTATLAKALWLQRHEPESWRRTRRIIFPKDYLSYRLGGSLHTDLTEASAVCLFDCRSQRWWPEECTVKLFPSREKLPEIVPSTQVVGQLAAGMAERTGIPAGTPVVAGGSDATVESISIGLTSEEQCKIRLGTAGALVTITRDLAAVTRGKYYLWSYLYPGRWMLDNNTRACAHSTAWFRDTFLADEADSDCAYRRIMEEASAAPLGSDGLFFHPYLQGEDSPYWDPALKGSFFGLRASHNRGHFARAVYEGTAFALRDARTAFGPLTERFRQYVLVGGGTRNPVWVQIIADVLGIEAGIPEHSGASFGAAMLAGVGIGVFRDLDEAIRRCVRVTRTVRADPAHHLRYGELFERYRRMKTIFDPAYAAGEP